MELTLAGGDVSILRDTIEKAVNDLLMEIARTDNRKMREMLRRREEVLRRILGRLEVEEHVA